MSITSSRNVQIHLSGDVTKEVIQSALDNTSAMDKSDLVTLNIGSNTITVPSITGFTITGLTIIPPAGNTNVITLKGVGGDTGFPIHLTDPTSIGLGAAFASLVLSVTAQVVGVQLIWT